MTGQACTHSTAVGYADPPRYPEQKDLQPGQVRCTSGCDGVFSGDKDWIAASEAAMAASADREAG